MNAYYLNQFISTTLSSVGGIDDSQTTGIILASVSGITTDKPGILCLSYTSSIDTTKAEWITYTSIDGTNELQGVTRGAESFSAKSHANGVTVAFPISESHINNLNDALIIDGAETNLVTGVISPDGTSSDADTELVTKSYADGGLVNSMSRQAIINGNFDVWQRGTSFSSSTSYTADRWVTGENTSTGDITRESFTVGQTDVPNEPKYYISVDVTSAEGTSSYYNIGQKIESVRSFAGQSITVSFYAKADSALDMAVEAWQNFGSGGSPSTSNSSDSEKITLTTSWAKYSVTLDVDSISGKTIGTTNDGYLVIALFFDAGSDYNARTDSLGNQSGVFDIAQVQVCAGDVALPFMPKSYAQELADCQRYYILDNPGVGNYSVSMVAIDTTNAFGRCTFPVTMRTTPTITLYSNTNSDSTDQYGTGVIAGCSVSSSGISEQGFSRINTSNTWTSGTAIRFQYIADAEL